MSLSNDESAFSFPGLRGKRRVINHEAAGYSI